MSVCAYRSADRERMQETGDGYEQPRRPSPLLTRRRSSSSSPLVLLAPRPLPFCSLSVGDLVVVDAYPVLEGDALIFELFNVHVIGLVPRHV